jgi:hypothetical protein
MVEVFKTNVEDPDHARALVEEIHQTFRDYIANFDLEDCDNILRVECLSGIIHVPALIDFLQEFGCQAEVLPDEPPPDAYRPRTGAGLSGYLIPNPFSCEEQGFFSCLQQFPRNQAGTWS